MSGSREEILATGHVTAKDFDEAAEIAMALFAAGQRMCAERGLILVDTKYEFGRTKDGRLVVIDEIHTPDSSRFWLTATYEERFAAGKDPESLDKDFVRRWYIVAGLPGRRRRPRPSPTTCASAPRALHRGLRAHHRRAVRARARSRRSRVSRRTSA